MESTGTEATARKPRTELRLLGPMSISRDGIMLRLPPSRKVRALIAYLAVAKAPVTRERTSALLWDVPNDPRGELRWCLSRIRAVLDTPGSRRVLSRDGRIALDLEGVEVDALEIDRAVRAGLAGLGLERLNGLAARARGDFLEGVDLDRSAEFGMWLAAERSAFRSHRIAILAEIARRTPVGAPEGLTAAREWLDLAPLDPEAHARFLAELGQRNLVADAERHLGAAERLFSDEGADFESVRRSWAESRRPPPVPAAGEATARSGVAAPQSGTSGPARRAAIAVMPFRRQGAAGAGRSPVGDGLTHDVITRLAKLRSLMVIARGSVFALAEEPIGPEETGRRLGVDYVATGFVTGEEGTVRVLVELAETASSHIVRTDSFEGPAGDTFAVLDEIGDGIVSALAAEIEIAERNRALLKHPDSLDAWEAYHRGLWHMYRFTRSENAAAAEFFRRSARLDPTFSRAYSGLSFTHWQNAFQHWGDRAEETRLAIEAAGQSLSVDEHNPSAHWSMGRAMWLAGKFDEAVGELEHSVRLSPNFALGHYALSFVHAQTGDPEVAIRASDHSRLLSPYDPLLFGMLGTRALAHVRLGAFEEAAEWALRAAARPNAHSLILAIAAYCLALAGRVEEARRFARRIVDLQPDFRGRDFLTAFHFAPDAASRFHKASALIGFRD